MENRGIREACENTDRFILNERGSSRRKAPFGVFFVHKKSHHLIETINSLKQ